MTTTPINNWRSYLQESDKHREAFTVPRPPRWTDTTPALASKIYNAQILSLPKAPHDVKRIWDKYFHMGNQAKAAKTAEEYHNNVSCPLCGQTDSEQRWITQFQDQRSQKQEASTSR